MSLVASASRDLAAVESYGLSSLAFLVLPMLLLVGAGFAMQNWQL